MWLNLSPATSDRSLARVAGPHQSFGAAALAAPDIQEVRGILSNCAPADLSQYP